MKLGNLKVTKVLYCAHRTSLKCDGLDEHAVLAALEDEKTGEKGHLFHYLEVDKRDIMDEETFTDNPRLFDNEHPEHSELLGLFTKPVGGCDEATMNLILDCRTCSMIVYEEGSSGWGLYAKKFGA